MFTTKECLRLTIREATKLQRVHLVRMQQETEPMDIHSLPEHIGENIEEKADEESEIFYRC